MRPGDSSFGRTEREARLFPPPAPLGVPRGPLGLFPYLPRRAEARAEGAAATFLIFPPTLIPTGQA